MILFYLRHEFNCVFFLIMIILSKMDQNEFDIFIVIFLPLQDDVFRFSIRSFVPLQPSSTIIDDVFPSPKRRINVKNDVR